jgi:excinuclease UvrABC nuclease subunit
MEALEFIDVPWGRSSGVYMLMHDDIVVYVGQSKHLITRLYQHNHAARGRGKTYPGQPKRMTFNGVKVLPYPADELDWLEQALIAHYKPKYNTCHRNVTLIMTPDGLKPDPEHTARVAQTLGIQRGSARLPTVTRRL